MFIATSGGAHPPEKLAKAASEQIGALIEIDETSQSEDARLARRQKPRLILDIANAIEDHHAQIMTAERELLAEKGTPHLSNPIQPDAFTLDDAVTAVQACAKGTMFEDAVQTAQAADAIRQIIGSWFATAIDIERDWVAKGHTIGPDHRAQVNPDHNHRDPHVRAWLAART
jgi:hypothetical protein